MEYKYDTRDVLIDLCMNDDQASVNGFEHIHELVLYIEELQSRIAELEKDAARYRWLREDGELQGDTYNCNIEADLDAAIDEAMQKD